MTILSTVDFENETDGNSVANLPAGWSITGTSAGTFTASTAAAIHGTLGARLAAQTSGYRRFEYAETVSTGVRVLRFYVVFRSFASGNTYFFSSDSGSDVRVNSDRTLTLRDEFTAVSTSTATVSLDTPYRFEYKVDTTADTQEVRVYEGENTTPIDTLTGPLAVGSITRFTLGLTSASSGFAADFDTVKIADDWVGPEDPAIPNVDLTGDPIAFSVAMPVGEVEAVQGSDDVMLLAAPMVFSMEMFVGEVETVTVVDGQGPVGFGLSMPEGFVTTISNADEVDLTSDPIAFDFSMPVGIIDTSGNIELTCDPITIDLSMPVGTVSTAATTGLFMWNGTEEVPVTTSIWNGVEEVPVIITTG